jgi:eukaryotic-like serine/threonine-protein kinase
MPQRWSYVLLSLLASSLIFGSCKPKISSDDPSPVVYSPNVIIGSNNQVVYALNPTTGVKSWELGLPCQILASPIVYKGSVYIASSNRDTIYKVNSRTGEITKKITFGNGSAGVKATPIADGNLLYVAGMSGTLFAIDTGSYNTKWSYTANGPLESSPTIYNGSIYFASTLGTVYRMEKTTGNITPGDPPVPTWSLNISGAKFVSSPAIGDPFLFIGSVNDSNMYCLLLDVPGGGGTGVEYWRYKTKGGIRSSPNAYKGTCIFGCDDFTVYCLDTGLAPFTTVPDLRWKTTVASEVTSSPVGYNQTVYVGCKDYKLYALKIADGKVKWSFSSGGIITSSPLPYNNMVYVGSYDKYLYALDSARGTVKWKSNINGQIDCSPVLDDLTKLTGYNSQISGYTN